MKATQHKLVAVIPVGDPDLGAEVECEIAFTFTKGSPDYWNKSGGHWEQGWAGEVEFVSATPLCNGKPSPYYGAFADMEQASLNDIAESWLLEDGFDDAVEIALDDAERDYDRALDAYERRADR